MIVIKQEDPDAVLKAMAFLRDGGVISFATETVYALACDAKNDEAVKRIYQLKQRSKEKPIAVLVSDTKALKENFAINKSEEFIAKNFMPGPLTLIVHKKDDLLSPFLNKNHDTIGVRIPNHKFSLSLLKEFGQIIAATSANITSQKSAISAKDVINYFSDEIDLLVDGGVCEHKIASTVIKLTNQNIEILREGLIKKEQLLTTLKEQTLE